MVRLVRRIKNVFSELVHRRIAISGPFFVLGRGILK